MKKFFAAIFFVLFNLAALELGLRVVHAVYPLEMPERLKDTFDNKWLAGFDWQNGKTRLYHYRQKPGATTNGHAFEVNRWGFRGKDFLARSEEVEETFRIVVLGDSQTVGQGIAAESRYTDLLEKRLRAEFPDRKIEVINLGVQGFETLQEFRILSGMWEVVGPDLVIVGFWTNDPNLHYQYYPKKDLPLPTWANESLRKFLLFRLVEPFAEKFYRKISRIPTHDEEVLAAYDPRSEDWKIFQKSVQGIATLAKRTGNAPIVLFMQEVQRAKRDKMYEPVKAAFEEAGFIWTELTSGYKPVSRFDYHAGESTHARYAEILFPAAAETVREASN